MDYLKSYGHQRGTFDPALHKLKQQKKTFNSTKKNQIKFRSSFHFSSIISGGKRKLIDIFEVVKTFLNICYISDLEFIDRIQVFCGISLLKNLK